VEVGSARDDELFVERTACTLSDDQLVDDVVAAGYVLSGKSNEEEAEGREN
jgi:hypothetical protein